MKSKILFSLFVLMFPVCLLAQTINGKLISEIKSDYIQIEVRSSSFGDKVKVEIDYGQGYNSFKPNENQIKDENGKPFKFDSIIGVLNFMDQNGYELISSHSEVSEGSGCVIYVLKRK